MENSGGITGPDLVPGLLPLLILLHLLMLLTFLVCVYVSYSRVEIGHPVFACLFQEVVVLSLCEVAEVSLLVLLAVFESERLTIAYMFVARVALQIHPNTWLVVTCLR